MLLTGLATILVLHTCVAQMTGPCPAYNTMASFDLAKGKTPWAAHVVLESSPVGDLKGKCTKNTFVINPDKTVASSSRGVSVQNPSQAINLDATLTLTPGKTGVFDFTPKQADSPMGKAAERKFYVLDTDYTTYLVGVTCFGDGSSSHIAIGQAAHSDKAPSNEFLEKAKTTLTGAGFDAAQIKTVDQASCP